MLSEIFIEFATSAKQNYDLLLTAGKADTAEILELSWRTICAAGVRMTRKIIAFNNPDVLALAVLRDAAGYLCGHVQIDTIRQCAAYLDHLTEQQPMYEYISAFTCTHLDPWSIHTDAAYIHCKLRVCGIVSHLLTSDDPVAVNHCRSIDNWVLERIQPMYRKKYTRLAENRTTFASITRFCKHAIDTKRDSQEYLCNFVNFVNQLGEISITMRPTKDESQYLTPSDSEHPITSDTESDGYDYAQLCANMKSDRDVEYLSESLMYKYKKPKIMQIARALHIDPDRPKIDIAVDIIKILGDNALSSAFIDAKISKYFESTRKRRREV